MTTFERVTYRTDDGKRHTLILKDARELTLNLFGRVLVGAQVDRDGCITGTHTTAVIGLDLITKRTPLIEDLFYGWLVPLDRESEQSRRRRRE